MPQQHNTNPQYLATIQQYVNGGISIQLEPSRLDRTLSFNLALFLFNKIMQAQLANHDHIEVDLKAPIEIENITYTFEDVVSSVMVGKSTDAI